MKLETLLFGDYSKRQLKKIKGADRKEAYCRRALADFDTWLEQINA